MIVWRIEVGYIWLSQTNVFFQNRIRSYPLHPAELVVVRHAVLCVRFHYDFHTIISELEAKRLNIPPLRCRTTTFNSQDSYRDSHNSHNFTKGFVTGWINTVDRITLCIKILMQALR